MNTSLTYPIQVHDCAMKLQYHPLPVLLNTNNTLMYPRDLMHLIECKQPQITAGSV